MAPHGGRGAETDLPLVLVWLVEPKTRAGHWDLARHNVEQGYAAAQSSGAIFPVAAMRATRAILLACRAKSPAPAVTSMPPSRLADAAAGICSHSVLPDDVEAVTRLGAVADAERLLRSFEVTVRVHKSGWARGADARCRALVSSARPAGRGCRGTW